MVFDKDGDIATQRDLLGTPSPSQTSLRLGEIMTDSGSYADWG